MWNPHSPRFPMISRFLRRPFRGAVPIALVLAAACTDGPVGPDVKPEPVPLVSIECRVNVPALSMACSYPEEVLAGSAVRTTRLMGGQDRFVKLANYGNTEENDVLSMFVTVQNLLADPLGTPDGNTVTGVKLFIPEDPSNGVVVANPTGTDFFTGANQPFFLYNQILTTYQVSDPMLWQFTLNGATTFIFKVYVYASQADESGNGLDAVWDGSSSTDWSVAANWTPATVPGAASAVQVPPATSIPGAFMPVLTANASALHLRVGTGSTLGLGGYSMAVGGNVDGAGAISNGSVTMSGSGALLKGTLPSLFVTGSTALQGATKTTGAVSVTGSLTVADSALSISIP
jgi:hypothetical protein